MGSHYKRSIVRKAAAASQHPGAWLLRQSEPAHSRHLLLQSAGPLARERQVRIPDCIAGAGGTGCPVHWRRRGEASLPRGPQVSGHDRDGRRD